MLKFSENIKPEAREKLEKQVSEYLDTKNFVYNKEFIRLIVNYLMQKGIDDFFKLTDEEKERLIKELETTFWRRRFLKLALLMLKISALSLLLRIISLSKKEKIKYISIEKLKQDIEKRLNEYIKISGFKIKISGVGAREKDGERFFVIYCYLVRIETIQSELPQNNKKEIEVKINLPIILKDSQTKISQSSESSKPQSFEPEIIEVKVKYELVQLLNKIISVEEEPLDLRSFLIRLSPELSEKTHAILLVPNNPPSRNLLYKLEEGLIIVIPVICNNEELIKYFKNDQEIPVPLDFSGIMSQSESLDPLDPSFTLEIMLPENFPDPNLTNLTSDFLISLLLQDTKESSQKL